MSVPCKLCGKTNRAEGCDHSELWVPGAFCIKRVPYASLVDAPCHDCGTSPGKYHHLDCDMERCPVCNGQLLICGHLDVTYDQWLEEHRARVSAERDAATFDRQALMTTKCFTAAFTKDVVDDMRRSINALGLEIPKDVVADVRGRFQAVLDQLSLLQQVVTIEPIPETDTGPKGYFRAAIKGRNDEPLVFAEGNSPHQAVTVLHTMLDDITRERDAAFAGEHHFRSALRHVQTELTVMQQALTVAHRQATRALDGADGTAFGHYEDSKG
jgi:hypothetical protein